MSPTSLAPSLRLLRAAAAECRELERQRELLGRRRQRAQDALEAIDVQVREIDERLALLARLAGDAGVSAAGDTRARPEDTRGSTAGDTRARPEDTRGSTAGDEGTTVGLTALRGPAIRSAAVRAVLSAPEQPRALHYRQWYALLAQTGQTVAGKDPLAVFLTQLSRCPVVRRGAESGVYELDLDAPARLRAQLHKLHGELRGLVPGPAEAPPREGAAGPAATDLRALRRRRAALTQQIGQVEKALQEAIDLLEPAGAMRVAATA